MRYGLAITLAIVIIGAGMLFVHQARRSIEQRFSQILKEAKGSGNLPAGIDQESTNSSDVGFRLFPTEVRRAAIDNLLIAWRILLIPLILLGSLGAAHLFKVGSER